MNAPSNDAGSRDAAHTAQLARWKQQAADEAVAAVEPGMVVGLGSGSTAVFAVRRIGALIDEGRLGDIVAVPTSLVVEAEALRLGIPLAPPHDPPVIDLTIDGADEVDPKLDLIKGGGGALLREKLVAQLSRREIIVVDETKLSPKLGTRCALPVEVIAFGWKSQARYLESLGAQVVLRHAADGRPFTTDQGNRILDCTFGPIDDPHLLAEHLASRAGIVEHGLFLNLATDVIVAGGDGVRHLKRENS